MQYRHIISLFVRNSLICLFMFLPAARALETRQGARRPLVIKHIRKEQAGVLISRPDPFDERMSDIIIAHDIASVADYARWLSTHMRYRSDEGKDIWSLPEDTLTRGRGDCEDLAFLNQAALSVLGYEPRVLCILRAFRSHAICVFKDEGYYKILDNTRLKSTPARSFDELARYLLTAYNCASIGEPRLPTQDYEVLFRRRDLASK